MPAMGSMGRAIASTGLALALAVTAFPRASAQEDETYRELLESAVGEYNAGRYAEARALFRQAHRRSPNARTLRGIGMAAFEMREYVEALRALRGALEEERRPLSDAQREHVEGLIERANAFVGRFQVRLAPETARLHVDGAPPRLEPDGTLLLDLGEHRLEATCPGCTPVTRVVQVRGGESQGIVLSVPPAEEAGPRDDGHGQDDTTGAEPPAPTSRPSVGGGSGSVAPVLLLGLGGALLAGAAGGVLWWLDRSDELDRCRGAGAACRNEGSLTSERDLAVGLTVAMGLAAVAAGLTGVLLLGGDDDGDGQAVRCAPSMGGLGCATRF